MPIRLATEADRSEILELHLKSQLATGIPDPDAFPPESLEGFLYHERKIGRYVAVSDIGSIVGHAMIETPDPAHVPLWRAGLGDAGERELIELAGAFVDPGLKKQGIWTQLLEHRLDVIRKRQAVSVSATWRQNEHVKRKFIVFGGVPVGAVEVRSGSLNLFVFP